jgi:type 1 glutamine amidotransferase
MHLRVAIIAVCSILPDYSGTARVCSAAEPLSNIKVLIVTGGHGFERKPFFDMFRQEPDLTFEEARQGQSATAYERDDLRDFDVVLLYDMKQEITAEQRRALVSLTERGTGIVVLHHALVSYQDWPEYEKIAGGRYPEGQDHRGEVTKELGYRHDVDIPVEIIAKDHPVAAGLSDFVIHDEIYWGFRVAPDVTPLLRTSHPDSGNPLAWAHEAGKSRVVTIQLGDSPSAYADRDFRRLVRQSVQWVARR